MFISSITAEQLSGMETASFPGEAHVIETEGPEFTKAVAYLNGYTNEKAQQMLARWQQLAVHLIVKYNDMVVKPERSGKFLRTSTGIGERPERPGYPEQYAREMLKRAE